MFICQLDAYMYMRIISNLKFLQKDVGTTFLTFFFAFLNGTMLTPSIREGLIKMQSRFRWKCTHSPMIGILTGTFLSKLRVF